MILWKKCPKWSPAHFLPKLIYGLFHAKSSKNFELFVQFFKKIAVRKQSPNLVTLASIRVFTSEFTEYSSFGIHLGDRVTRLANGLIWSIFWKFYTWADQFLSYCYASNLAKYFWYENILPGNLVSVDYIPFKAMCSYSCPCHVHVHDIPFM
jgi:hypothetical protein